ncbi:MAG: hypothetical protein GX628_03240 [Clostridiales bacterium]|nr:hypothetical protein [Clostridiales bacterium]
MTYNDTSLDKILGPLPDLFSDGKGGRFDSPARWAEQREHILENSVPLLFGGMPPKPEVFSCRHMYASCYLITAGTAEKQISFPMQLHRPEIEGKCPVVICGDLFGFNDEKIKEANRRGFIAAVFNRNMLSADNYRVERDYGLFNVYPDGTFSTIAAWAWGYQRCVDALCGMSFVDTDCIAIAGLSRGGKTTLLAAATDERIKFIQSACSGAAGSGCFRYEQYADEETIKKYGLLDPRCETLADLIRVIPYWLGPDMKDYVGRETELPFDMHFLKAAIAPRYLLETISMDDVWANPRGCYLTYKAAREVYEFLGVGDHIAQNFRYGPHSHDLQDYCKFYDFIECVRKGVRYPWHNSELIYGDVL